MKSKKCSKCDIDLPIDSFYKKKGGKLGLASRCKSCEGARTASWAACNREKRNASQKKWYESNAAIETRKFKQNQLLLQNKKECSRCNEEIYLSDFYDDQRASDGKFSACKKCIAKSNFEWSQNNKEKVREKAKRHRNKKVENRLHARMSNAIWYCLRDKKKRSSWLDYVGYSVSDLKERLESQFSDGMSWEVFLLGEIHIDHIIPKSWFNFTSPEDEEFIKCWALDNLQPLWASQNCSKGNRYAG